MLQLLDRDTNAQAWAPGVRQDQGAEVSLVELPQNSNKAVFSKLHGTYNLIIHAHLLTATSEL